jgi:hypothetical protein
VRAKLAEHLPGGLLDLGHLDPKLVPLVVPGESANVVGAAGRHQEATPSLSLALERGVQRPADLEDVLLALRRPVHAADVRRLPGCALRPGAGA